jgi:ABC-type nitrate/sulfonate/bicarbonate transport system permease component
VGRRRAYLRRSRWDVVRVAVGTLIGLLIGFLVGFFVGLIDGS